jgi:Fibronectin type III domain
MNRTSIKLAVASHSKPAEHHTLAKPLISTMKALLGTALGILISTCFICEAQSIASHPTQIAVPAPTPYAITTQNANSRVWQRMDFQESPSGGVVTNTHSYTELNSGLNHLVNGQWVESKEWIDILPNGTAVATNGQHQAYFPGDIYQGQIELVTSEGLQLYSRPLALSYFDGTNTVVIAELTNSIGVVVGNNQVVYPNAFNGVAADLRYFYTKSGFEQNVVIRQQPPTPESLGLNPATSRLQIMTEFFSPPQPAIQSSTLPAQAGVSLTDESLAFGSMQMIQGRAFLMGQNANGTGALVSKHWAQVNGRQILIEEVPVNAILEGLAALPLTAVNSSSGKNSHTASKHLKLPPQRLAQKTSKPMMLAKAEFPAQGFVLDYQTVTGILTNYTFKGDTTYYINGSVSLSAVTTFEGGAVIKYTNNATLAVGFNTAINVQTSAYRPVIFTASDDNTVGEAISGSTGNPINYYANPALSINSPSGSQTMANFRIAYAKQALSFTAATVNLYHGQIVNCQNGIAGAGNTVVVENALFANVLTNLTVNGLNFILQNVTFAGSAYLMKSSGGGPTFTNCIFASVTNFISGVNSYTMGSNGFYNSFGGSTYGTSPVSVSSYPFQSAGAANYYLANGCAFANAGTTNIDSVLLAALKQKTTCPPLVYTNVTFSVNTNLSAQAQRDTDTPDFGYHYDPLDYLVDKLTVTNATLTVNSGTAIAGYNEPGILLQTRSTLVLTGTPLAPDWLVRYQSVQEQPVALGGTNVFNGQAVSSPGGATAIFQFSKFACPAGGGYHLYDAATSTYSNLLVQNCEFWSGKNDFSGTNVTSVATLMNNLFWRSPLYASNTSASATLNLMNNLAYGAAVTVSQPGGGLWTAFNNDFDTCTITNSTLTNGYNAYLNSTGRLNPTNANDVVQTASLTYRTGPLGGFYAGSNLLVNKGNTNANLLGLYHFTTQTNLVSGLEIKETNSIVDIGYHYVATDTNGIPLDSNGDGIPDYLEDANGDGLIDSGEMPWDLPDQNLLLWLKADAITGLTNNAPVGTWLDNSGRSNNATQGTSANQPLWVTNALNGLPIVRFNGTSSYFNFLNNFLTGTTGLEAFVVLKSATNQPAAYQALWEDSGSGSGQLMYPNSNGHIRDGTGNANYPPYDLGTPAQPLTNYNVYEVSGTTGPWAAWLDGQLLGSLTGNTYGVWGGNLGLGWDSYNQSYFFAGDVAEVLMFNRPLTGAERSTVNNYLGLKYGLVTGVPAAPTNLVATAVSTNQISLTWNETFNWWAAQVSVQRSTASNGTYQVVAQLGQALSYLDTNLAAGTTYYYKVTAVNAAGSSAGSNLAWATTLTNGVSLPFGNLLLWLKADSGLAQTGTNTPVSYWVDQSGSTNNATQGTSANQPLWVTNALNGLPIVRFNGTSSYFSLPQFMSGTVGAEEFVVLKAATNQPAGTPCLWRLGGSETANNYPNISGQIAEGFGSTAVYNLGVPAQPLTNYNVYEVSATNGLWAAWLDGQLLGSSMVNTYGWGAWATLQSLGCDAWGGPSSYFAGDVAEVLMFNRPLTGDEKVSVGSYLVLKYGLTQFATNSSPPSTPTNFVAVGIAPYQLNLQWGPASTNATAFDIQRKQGTGGTYQEIGSASVISNFVDLSASPTSPYFYRVSAKNYFGQSGYSTEISPPTVALTNYPATIFENTNNLLGAQAMDFYGTISNVQLFANNVYFCSTTTSPYTLNWMPTFQTTYSLVLLAADNLGNSQYSAPVTVSVYLDSNGDGIPDYLQVLQGNNPLNPWPSPGSNTNLLNFSLLIPTNAVIVP